MKIMNALANGVHSATGEVFAAYSAYQHPDTVRALFEAVRALEDRPRGKPAKIQDPHVLAIGNLQDGYRHRRPVHL